MDRRRIELQLRAILVIYRGEKNHRSAETMKGIRERAEILFRDLEASVEPYPDLKKRLADARHELDGQGPSEEQAR